MVGLFAWHGAMLRRPTHTSSAAACMWGCTWANSPSCSCSKTVSSTWSGPFRASLGISTPCTMQGNNLPLRLSHESLQF